MGALERERIRWSGGGEGDKVPIRVFSQLFHPITQAPVADACSNSLVMLLESFFIWQLVSSARSAPAQQSLSNQLGVGW